MTTPFWPRPETSHPVAFPADSHFDAVVVGAGFTGLTTALLLAEAGRRVAVLEARTVGAGASGSTTAKTTLLQGVRLSTLARTHSIDVAGDYLAAHRFGQDWLRKFCEDNAVDVDVASAFTYAPPKIPRPTSAANTRRHANSACPSSCTITCSRLSLSTRPWNCPNNSSSTPPTCSPRWPVASPTPGASSSKAPASQI